MLADLWITIQITAIDSWLSVVDTMSIVTQPIADAWTVLGTLNEWVALDIMAVGLSLIFASDVIRWVWDFGLFATARFGKAR